jgi:hypothetical protein
MDKALDKEALENLTMDQILNRVRGLAKRLLERGELAPNVTYALAFVATELGLLCSNDPAGVVAVVLKGVSNASRDYAESMDDKEKNEEPPEKVPDGATIH